MTNLLKKVLNFVSSFGLAVVLILIMLLLTLLGTLEQVDTGLFQVQKKYFESYFLVHEFEVLDFVIPLPLPGAYLVIGLLFINLVAGGILRLRKSWRRPGILIIHLGMLLLIVGSFITYQFSYYGNMRLYEGDTSNEFLSFFDWAVEVGKSGEDSLLVIPQEDFADLGPNETRTFHSESLPFDVVLSGYFRNSSPVPVGSAAAPQVHGVDGFYLQRLADSEQSEQDIAGCYVTALDKTTSHATEGILWGLSLEPLSVHSGDAAWTIDLTRKRWQVPFTVTLDKFIHELHPGTNMAASFESEITKREGDSEEAIRIYMNHPLRYNGYTFFQESWGRGTPETGPDGPLFSVFRVVKNPGDHVPLWSCIIISFGLLVHFLQKLGRYLEVENKRRLA